MPDGWARLFARPVPSCCLLPFFSPQPTAVSDTATDFYLQKTNAELLFFAEHPELYQASLVEAAQRELRRRGITPAMPAVTYAPAAAPAAGPPIGLLTLLAAVVLLVALGAFYYVKQKDQPAPAAAVPAPRKDPPQLTEVATSAIPSYDVASAVAQQLRQLPAVERGNAKALKQFRELAKRFWTAETQTEYLTKQAHDGKAGPLFADQALVVRETWRAWNHAAVYGYEFGPEMQAQFKNMGNAASSQQHVLESLPDLLPEQKFLTDKELTAREAEVQDWLATLLPTSPVTGQPYRATVLKIRM